MPFKAVAFDLDGTLVQETSSWYKIHKHFGTYEQSVANMELYVVGKISYDQFMTKDISLWHPRPSKQDIERILLDYRLSPNTKDTISILHSTGYKVFIVTTAPDILANAVANELGISNVVSNGFIFDELGFLTTKAVFNVDLLNKQDAFRKALSRVNIDCHQCIAVGDSKYDIGFLRTAGKGIAYKPDDTLRREAFPIIDNMADLIGYI